MVVYTDGACVPNPGKGGWGAVIVQPDGTIRKISGGSSGQTTNNRMEMTAVLMGLRELRDADHQVIVRSDSELVIKTLKGAYRRRENLDLWRQIDHELARFRSISFEWVRGHDGNHYNEMADRLANQAIASPVKGSGSKHDGLKCHQCRRPMRHFSTRPSRNTNGEEHWYRCDQCSISAYKDRRGAHYLPRSFAGGTDDAADPFAITAPIDPALRRHPVTWRMKTRRRRNEG